MSITRGTKFDSLPKLIPFKFNQWNVVEKFEEILDQELAPWRDRTFYAIGRIDDQFILILNSLNEPVLLPYQEDAYAFDSDY